MSESHPPGLYVCPCGRTEFEFDGVGMIIRKPYSEIRRVRIIDGVMERAGECMVCDQPMSLAGPDEPVVVTSTSAGSR